MSSDRDDAIAAALAALTPEQRSRWSRAVAGAIVAEIEDYCRQVREEWAAEAARDATVDDIAISSRGALDSQRPSDA